MLVASQSMFKISRLEAQLARMFQMKDLGATKQILGIGVHRDEKNGKLWLSQQKSMEKILMWFNMNIVKLVNIPLVFHCNLSSSLCPGSKEEKVMSHVPHANIVGRLMFAMECSNISHAVGVVSGHMEKPGEEHGNECFSILEAQKHKYHLQWLHDLVCGYVDSEDLDKKRPTSGYVSHECKDLLGKFGQVHDMVFCGGRSIVHLTNRPTYQNGTMHHFVRQGY
jgi:hypothetical protein